MKKTILMLLGLVCISINGQYTGTEIKENKNMLYSAILLNVTSENHYRDYKDVLKAFLKESGGYIEREFIAEAPRGGLEGLGQPNRILVIFYGGNTTFDKLKNDKTYLEINTLLSQAGNNIHRVYGLSKMSHNSTGPVNERFYLMKISYFNQNAAGREEMLSAIGPILDPYGFRTERMIHGLEAEGIDVPDEVSIHFHEKADQAGALQQDPEAIKVISEYNTKYVKKFAYISLRPR